MRRFLGVTTAAVLVLAVAGGVAAWLERDQEVALARPAAAALPDPLEPLHAWDRLRAQAWAAADADALRRLYVDGSRAGRRDVRLLLDYRRRGLRVEGLRSQVLEAHVERREADRLVVSVTERVLAGTAVGPSGSVRLPASAPRRRVLVLVRPAADGPEWVLAAVRPIHAGG